MRRPAAAFVVAAVLSVVFTPAIVAQGRPAQPARPGGAGGGGGASTQACGAGCGGGGSSYANVTPYGEPDTIVVTSNPAANSSVSFVVTNAGTVNDWFTLTMSCAGSETCVSQSESLVNLNPGSWAIVYVTFTPGQPTSSGTVSLTATGSGGGGSEKVYVGKAAGTGSAFSPTGSYNVVSIPGHAPIISLAPYSSGLQFAADGVIYQHALPAIGSMGVQRSLALVYNSAAARPTALVTVDVTNPASPYPSAYQLQVQRSDNGALLTLLNGATSVFYAAGSTTTTRLVAGIDLKANGLATGAYPVNIVVTSVYALGAMTRSVSSRVLVNDQSGSPYGAGVGLTGVARLYPNPTSGYGMLLVDGSGALAYFDRSCSSCTPFVSPAGDSRALTWTGGSYLLTALDGSRMEFNADGTLWRTWLATGTQDLTFTYASGLFSGVTDPSGRGFALSYAGGKLTQISDFSGRTTTVSVVSAQLATVTDPDGLSESLSYGANAMLSQVINRAGGQWIFTYNALNQQQSATGPAATDYTGASVRPASSVTTMAQVVWQPSIAGTSSGSPKGNIRPDTVRLSVTDPLGNVSRAAHDRFGLVTKVVDALGQVTTITRDTLGQVTQAVEPNGHTVTNSYSGYLISTHTDNTTGEVLSYTYSGNRLIKVSGGAARVDYFYHDGAQGPAGTLRLGYLGNTNSPGQPPTGGDTLRYSYPDAYGRDTAVTDGLGHRNRWIYASLAAGGNLTQAIDANGHVTSFQYNAYGLLSSTTLANGTAVSRATDIMNRDTSVTDPRGVLRFGYSSLGLTRVIDSRGQIYKYGLNAWGLTVAAHDLADTTRADSARYDVGGQARTVRTRRGDVITMTYDALGRLLTRSGPDFSTETFRYGLNGAWMVASNANATDSIVVDQAGRVSAVWQTVGGVNYQMSYTYDSHGRMVARSAPTGGSVTGSSLSVFYNANRGVVDTVRALGTSARYFYDAERKPSGITYNGGAWSHNPGFDPQHQVTQDFFTVAQLNNDFGLTLAYDSLGHVVNATWPPTSSHLPQYMRYDATGRLIAACSGTLPNCYDEYGQNISSYGQSYSYDASGNRTDAGGYPIIGAGNRTLRFKGDTLAYDLNGAIVQRSGLGVGPWNSTDTTRLQWNASGQLVRAEKWSGAGAHTVDTLLYDALGRRVGKRVNSATTWFVYDGNQVAMDISAASNTLAAEYAFAGDDLFGVRTPTMTGVAILTPMTGTVVGLAAAANGAEIKRYDVLGTPWSQQVPDTGLVLRYRMGSQEFDQEIGLYHLGARYYDPMMGRFLSEDPIGIAGGLNLYAYADNDPIGARDPSGMSSCRYNTDARGGISGVVCRYTCPDFRNIGECTHQTLLNACNQIDGLLRGTECFVVVHLPPEDVSGRSNAGGPSVQAQQRPSLLACGLSSLSFSTNVAMSGLILIGGGEVVLGAAFVVGDAGAGGLALSSAEAFAASGWAKILYGVRPGEVSSLGVASDALLASLSWKSFVPFVGLRDGVNAVARNCPEIGAK